MKRLACLGILALMVAVITAGPVHASSLLVNGSFEFGPDPNVSGTEPGKGGSITIEVGSDAILGWTVSRPNVDYVDAHWVSSDGSRSLDLDGTTGFGGVAQSFVAVPGTEYLVTFDMAGNPLGGDPTLKHMRVSAAGVFADFSFDTVGATVFEMGWVSHSWSFFATSPFTTLEFLSLNTAEAGYSGLYGPALDNVSVSAVPEPSTGLLCGSGLLLLLIHARHSMARGADQPRARKVE